MDKQLQIHFDNEEIINDNSLYNWCINNDTFYLLEEWDYVKNKNVTPKDISYGSDRKVWWKKSYDDPNTGKHFDFSWQASVSHRKEGRGCPYLSAPIKKIYVGFNDLASTHPHLEKEWDYKENNNRGLFITNVTYGSKKLAAWKCRIHGVYEAIIASRSDGQGCPYCAGKQVLSGFNDLKTLEPDIASEWDTERNGVGPETVTIGCINKYWWKCSKGHSWQATPNARTGTSRTGCPICSNKQILVGYNDLATTNPRVAAEWNYKKNNFTPQQVVAGSNKRVWWKCKFGHEYATTIYSKVLYNTGCSICNKERKTSFSEKAIYYYLKKYIDDTQENVQFDWLGKREIDIYIPSLNIAIEYDGSHWHKNIDKDKAKDLLCIANGIQLIRIRENECPDYESCAIKIKYGINKKYKTLDETILYLLSEYLNIEADVNIDRDYTIIMENYITKEKGKSINTERPDLVEEWDYEKNSKVNPEFVSLYSNKKVWWKCSKCNYSYQMVVNNRTGNKKSNCPVCASKKVKKGVNDLITTNPKLLEEWDFEKNFVSPYEISKGSHKKVYWKCKKGHSWVTKVYVRAIMKCGCPTCAGQHVDNDNSFANLYPDLLNEWMYDKNERDPFTVLPSSNVKFWWKCSTCGYEWECVVASRTKKGSKCPVCRRKKLIQK